MPELHPRAQKPGIWILIGGVACFAAAHAIHAGQVNLGGKSFGDHYVTWAADPALFALGVGFFLTLTGGCWFVAWKLWRR